jgi:hypothetical protein
LNEEQYPGKMLVLDVIDVLFPGSLKAYDKLGCQSALKTDAV